MSVRGIHAIATAEPERAALVAGDRAWTFGELDAATNRIAHALADRGVRPGDRVAVRCRNRPEIFAAWNAAARLGCLVVPISYRSAGPEVAHVLEDSGARVLVHDDSTADVDVATLDVSRGVPDDAPPWPPRDDHLGTPVMWMNYTSGTTGRPKGIDRPDPVPLVEAPPQPFMDFWGFGADDVHLLTGPAYHTAPGAYAQMHLVEGATVVVLERFDAEGCLRLIDEHGVTNSHMVPANFVRILQLDPQVRARYDLSSIRRILHGAAPCPEPVKRAVIELFPEGTVWEYYGASEGMGTVIGPEDWLEHPGSVGRPFPGLSITILDDDAQPLSPGEVGTVYLSSVPGYAPRYHNDPDKTAAAYVDDRFTVGDLGWLDDEGYLYLADRRTDLILRGGVNVYPAEVESVVAGHPDVVDLAVIGLPDERLGQRVHAIVELRAGSEATPDDLTRFASSRIADYKVPGSWEVVSRLPREPNGKVRKRDLITERSQVF
ncbi:MAG: AMP-binding protein [Actinobacteria bacterium]|nr:AMP-binding protein [Actinomycetota bacterium]